MTKTFVILFFCIVSFNSKAQQDKPANAVPINKEEALKFMTINDAIRLPAKYEVIKYEIYFANRNGIIKPADQKISNQAIKNIIASSGTGDKMIISGIMLQKDNRQIKLEDKVYIFR